MFGKYCRLFNILVLCEGMHESINTYAILCSLLNGVIRYCVARYLVAILCQVCYAAVNMILNPTVLDFVPAAKLSRQLIVSVLKSPICGFLGTLSSMMT